MMINRFALSSTVLVLATICVELALGRCVVAADVSDVLAAWHRYSKSVHAFQYQYDFSHTVLDGGRERVEQQSVSTLSLSGNKIAYAKEGKQHESHGRYIKMRNKDVFDGSDSKGIRWIENGRLTLGGIHVGQVVEQLVRHGENFGFWLAHRPVELLERHGFSAKERDLRLGRGDYVRNGIPCIEVVLKSASPDWRASVYLDPLREYLPVGFDREEVPSGLKLQTSIEYAPNAKIGWVVSKWDYKVFRSNGELKRTFSANVVKCSINEPVADEFFELEFPVGTHVERLGGDSPGAFIQSANGKLEPISAEELGVLHTPRPRTTPTSTRWWFLICTAVILAVLVVTYARYQKYAT